MGIIFDLDGTLLDTIEDIARITNYALLQHGFSAHDEKSYARMVGHGLKNLVTQTLPENTKDSDIEKVYNTLISEYIKNPVQDTLVYPGIFDLLDYLTEEKIPMAILSNKLHDITVQIVSIIFKQWKFEAVYGSQNGIPKKPDPFQALEISKIMGINPEKILFVGDSGADMATAVSSNMIPIGVSWGYRSVDDIQKAGARAIIHTPMELLKFL